jgi:predicted RNA-binding protein with PIN domain
MTGVSSPPRMRWLVDGMNVIGSRPDGWWRDRDAAKRRLLAELEGLDGEVSVVFDEKGLNADDEIVARVAADPDPAGITVVTSDAELQRRVREHGASVEGAGTFRRGLDEQR